MLPQTSQGPVTGSSSTSLSLPFLNPTHTYSLDPPSEAQQKFDLAISLVLAYWPALSLAVQNQWGGGNSIEKRDWFAGAISDLFAYSPNPNDIDTAYVEEFMLHVMYDEFEVNVDDGSAEEVAEEILRLRKETMRGEYARVDEMMRQWEERQRRGRKQEVVFSRGENEEDEDSETLLGDDEDDDDDSDGGVDVKMDDTPLLFKGSREIQEPEVDEDGFTKVVGRRKR